MLILNNTLSLIKHSYKSLHSNFFSVKLIYEGSPTNKITRNLFWQKFILAISSFILFGTIHPNNFAFSDSTQQFSQTSFAQTDFDSDGISDITLVSIGNAGKLNWSRFSSLSGQEDALGRLGQSGDQLIPAYWLEQNTPQIGIVTLNNNKIVWKILAANDTVLNQNFGQEGDSTLSGADFNGNGIADAALMRSSITKTGGTRTTWLIKHDPFTALNSTSEKEFNFGTNRHNSFYLSLDGIQDWAAYFSISGHSRSILRLKNPNTARIKILKRFDKSLSEGLSERPLPIRQEIGQDVIGFVKKTKKATRVFVRTITGKRVNNLNFPGHGTIVVGNFTNDPGEELALHNNEKFTVINPFNKAIIQQEKITGILVDHININTLTGNNNDSPSKPNDPQTPPIDGGQCSTIKSWPDSHIYKKVGSTHFDPTDVRRNTIGLIVKSGGSGPFPDCITAQDTAGNEIAKLGLYARGDGWEARYYAGYGCGDNTAYNGDEVARRAKENTGSPKVLFNFSATCYGPIDAGECIGSSQC